MMGLNVTKEHFLPLYIEAGIAMNADFGDNSKLINFEIPFGITYRLNIPNTEIYVSPYFGFHFKINVFWVNDKNNSYFDLIDDTHRFQFGMQLGGHIDFISRDCLAGGHRMNAANNNNGTEAEKNPWLASELYQVW